MGTGVGMPSYSLMAQGQVDKILSSRPDERRAIFEEAAGITKYKSKKEEALRKLERTGENLQRIGDIIVEVKRQINSMERQVNKARRYKEEFERLKEYELKVSQYQFQNLKKEKTQLQNKTREIEEKEASFSSGVDSTSHTLDKMRHELSSIEENISRIQAESYELSATIKTSANKVTLDEERIEELVSQGENLKFQMEELKRKATATSQDIEETRVRAETLERERQEKTSALAEKEQSVSDILNSVKETQKEISAEKAQEVELLAQKTRLRNSLNRHQVNLANSNARQHRLNIESERTQEDVDNIKGKYSACEQELKVVNEEVGRLSRELWDLKSNSDIQAQKKQKLQCRAEELARRIALLQSKLNFLQEATKKYEGFSSGVKSILSAKENQSLRIEGLFGAAADLIEVSPQYQIAIEMALGEFAQVLVAENRHAVQEAIDYLKAKDAGRAGFLCLDSLTPGKEETLRPSEGLLGRAQEFVKTEPRYQGLIRYLLANTFIARDLEAAGELLKSSKSSSLKIVTLDGEILTRAGAVGGSAPKDVTSSLIGRRERIKRLQAELEKLEQERAGLENRQTAQAREIEELDKIIQEKEPGLNKLKIKLANKQSEKLNIETQRKRFEDEASVLKSEINEAGEQIRQLQAEEKELNEQIDSLEEKQKRLQQKIQRQETSISQNNQKRQDTLIEIAGLKTEVSALAREAEDRKKRLDMLVESEAEQKRAHQARSAEAEKAEEKVGQLKQGIEQLKLQNRNLTGAKQDLEEKINRTTLKRREHSAAIRDLDEKAKNAQRELNEIREQRRSLQVKLTETNYKGDSLKEKMQQTYQLDLEGSLENIIEISPPEDSVFGEIKHLKGRLEGMGPVNLVALEESDQLQQRHSFLISQQEDLVSGQESLRKAITQINRTARQMFAETFSKIQVCFKEYFRILFNGGDARLILLDENKLLESGIEIVVRPPGKKLQNISLLSGGEKALTAIALLFAVFKVKPSPFCILDEVDAPLDEANVDRFANLLREFIKTSQFIIITHNKKTINMADIMYGITMEASGVSKIVSVKFTEDKMPPARAMAPAEV